jgi:hypothetical protein
MELRSYGGSDQQLAWLFFIQLKKEKLNCIFFSLRLAWLGFASCSNYDCPVILS